MRIKKSAPRKRGKGNTNCRSHQKGMNLLREGIAHPCGTVPRLERSTRGGCCVPSLPGCMDLGAVEISVGTPGPLSWEPAPAPAPGPAPAGSGRSQHQLLQLRVGKLRHGAVPDGEGINDRGEPQQGSCPRANQPHRGYLTAFPVPLKIQGP